MGQVLTHQFPPDTASGKDFTTTFLLPNLFVLLRPAVLVYLRLISILDLFISKDENTFTIDRTITEIEKGKYPK